MFEAVIFDVLPGNCAMNVARHPVVIIAAPRYFNVGGMFISIGYHGWNHGNADVVPVRENIATPARVGLRASRMGKVQLLKAFNI